MLTLQALFGLIIILLIAYAFSEERQAIVFQIKILAKNLRGFKNLAGLDLPRKPARF